MESKLSDEGICYTYHFLHKNALNMEYVLLCMPKEIFCQIKFNGNGVEAILTFQGQQQKYSIHLFFLFNDLSTKTSLHASHG